MACDNIADKLIDVDIQTQEIGHAAPQAEPVIGDEIVSMHRQQHGPDVDRRVHKEEEVERPGLRGHLERRARCQIAGDHQYRGLGPGMTDEFHDPGQVVLHAAQRRVLKLPLTGADVICMVVPEDAEAILCQIIRKRRII